jgi:hypothetical protein
MEQPARRIGVPDIVHTNRHVITVHCDVSRGDDAPVVNRRLCNAAQVRRFPNIETMRVHEEHAGHVVEDDDGVVRRHRKAAMQSDMCRDLQIEPNSERGLVLLAL